MIIYYQSCVFQNLSDCTGQSDQIAALHSSLTLLLYSFGLKETALWAVSSVLAAIFQAPGAYSASTKVKLAVKTISFKFFDRDDANSECRHNID
jgi:hypothetical protein